MLFIRVFRVALYPRPEGRGFTASLKINRDIGEQVPFVNLVKSAKTFAKSPEYEANPQYSLSRKKLCLNII
jgi:hypothetical protein